MTIKQKLSVNIGFIFIVVAVLVVLNFAGTDFVKEKLTYLTHRSTPYQLKSIEYQKAVQATIGTLLKQCSSSTMQELETYRKDASGALDEVKGILAAMEKLAGKADRRAYEELLKVAEQVTETTKMSIQAEEAAVSASQAIVQKLETTTKRLADLDMRVKRLQLNRFGTFGTFLAEAKDIEAVKNTPLLTHSNLATNALISNAELLSQGNKVEKAVLKMFTARTPADVDGAEGETRKGFEGVETAGKQLENLLKKLSEEQEMKNVSEVKATLLSLRESVAAAASGIRQKLRMRAKATELAATMDGIIKRQTETGRQTVALAYTEQEKAVSEVNTVIRRNSVYGVAAGSLALALSLLFGFVVYRAITRPLTALVEVSDSISKGDLSSSTRSVSRDEFGKVQTHIAGMVANLTDIVGRMKASTERLATSSGDLRVTADQLEKGAAAQGEQIEQSVMKIAAMTQTTGDIAKNTSGTDEMAQKMRATATVGRAAMERTVSQLESLGATVRESARKITALGEKSDEVSGIVAIIKGIADETNLLALNAAIEAARAGEFGRGFAVVADNVRQLAESTTTATDQIASVIGAMQSGVGDAAVIMEDGTTLMATALEQVKSTSEAIEEIVVCVGSVADMVQRIAVATEEQTAVSAAVSGRMGEIAGVTRQLGGSISEIKRTSQDLTAIAGDLDATAAWFKL